MNSKRHRSSPLLWRKSKKSSINCDRFCFQCHQTVDPSIYCTDCGRVFHRQCLESTDWFNQEEVCPECNKLHSKLESSNEQKFSSSDLKVFFETIVHQINTHSEKKKFEKLKSTEFFRSIDLTTIENSIKTEGYKSFESFRDDFKWIHHNASILCNDSSNVDEHRLMMLTKRFLHLIDDEFTEFEICSQCYVRRASSDSSKWFIEICHPPHPICWVKIDEQKFWPGKVFRTRQSTFDVRFFGRHNQAWIPLKDCFQISKECFNMKKKQNSKIFATALDELKNHIEILKRTYGDFVYAAPGTPLKIDETFAFLSQTGQPELAKRCRSTPSVEVIEEESPNKMLNVRQEKKISAKQAKTANVQNLLRKYLTSTEMIDKTKETQNDNRQTTERPDNLWLSAFSIEPIDLTSDDVICEPRISVDHRSEIRQIFTEFNQQVGLLMTNFVKEVHDAVQRSAQ